MSFDYGVTDNDLLSCRRKIKSQKDFLESFEFKNSKGDIKTYLDFSYSASLSPRYYAMIQNKINTLYRMAFLDNLEPIFLTVTLDGFFRDFLRGDYSRFTFDVRNKYKHKIPNNERYGYIGDKIDARERLDIHDLYKVLNFQFRHFLSSKPMRAITKEGLKYYFMLSYEPHKKDGVPHLHCLLYVPEKSIPKLYNTFMRTFPAPQNHKKINKRNSNRLATIVYEDQGTKYYETLGFQTDIRNPVGYIMKYVLKTFNDVKKNKKIDKLQAWYIINKIPRITTSRFLVPQWVYHHASLFNESWKYLTELQNDGYHERNHILKNFSFITLGGLGEFIYKNGYYCIKLNGNISEEWGEDKTRKIIFTDKKRISNVPAFQNLYDSLLSPYGKKWRFQPRAKKVRFKTSDVIPVTIDGNLSYEYDINTGEILQPFTVISSSMSTHSHIRPLSDQELFSEYSNFDIENGNLQRYASMKKELVKRGLIPYELININDYSISSIMDFKT